MSLSTGPVPSHSSASPTSLWRIFWHSASYEGDFLRRHRWDRALLLWLPLAAIVLIWSIFSHGHGTSISLGVVDESHTTYSDTAIRYVDATPEVQVTHHYPSMQMARLGILSRQVYGVLVIPKNFSTRILSAQPAPVTLLVNAQYGTDSALLQKGVQSAVATLSAGVEIKRLQKQGMASSQAKIDYDPIQVSRVSLFNPSTNYQQFLATTVLPALMHILVMVVGASTIGRELRDRRFDHWYQYITQLRTDLPAQHSIPAEQAVVQAEQTQHHPLNAKVLPLMVGMCGKFVWAMLCYAVWGAIILGLAALVQSSSIGSWLLTYATFLLLMMLSLWLGSIFVLATFSLRMGLSITGFFSAPSYAFAGITFPFVAIRDSAKYWSDLLPLTHYLKLHIAQLQMQAPVAFSLPIFYGFVIAVVVVMGLGAGLGKRALAQPQRWGER